MGAYATGEEVAAYLSDNPDLDLPPGVDEDGEAIPSSELERLIAHAERDVDRAIGGPPVLLATGLRLDPTALSAAQRGALARAVGAAVEYRLSIDSEALVGADDYVPSEVSIINRAGRPPGPRVAEEMSGYGLIRRSGCALPDPPPLLP
jgi:hypothetical protein